MQHNGAEERRQREMRRQGALASGKGIGLRQTQARRQRLTMLHIACGGHGVCGMDWNIVVWGRNISENALIRSGIESAGVASGRNVEVLTWTGG